jgi:uncharacterized protein
MKFATLAPLAAALAALASPAAAQSAPDFQNEAFITPYWTRVPVIEALGRSNLKVPPNRASFVITYLETDRDSKDAMKKAVERGRLAYETIKKAAGDSAMVQSSVNVTALFDQYRDRDGNLIDNQRSDKIRAYEARVTLSVIVQEVDKAGAARAAALALGPENSSGLSTYLEVTDELSLEAFESAVKDGTARAEATVRASGARLGQLMVVQEGGRPCLGQWSTTAGADYDYYKAIPAPPPPMSAMAMDAERLRSVTVTGQVVGGQQVTITQADLDALNLPTDDLEQTISASVCMIYRIER